MAYCKVQGFRLLGGSGSRIRVIWVLGSLNWP